MSCIKTYTGVMFDPLYPESELIDILDIAHALSMLCRANGHFRSFYSVGQHCINCALEAKARGYSKRVQLACLIHDASEAYLSDVTRPVKHELPKYLEIEKPLQESIWQKYLGSELTEEENSQVFRIDDAMLYHEFVALMNTHLSSEEPGLQSKPEFSFMGFEKTEKTFLRLFHTLSSHANDYVTVGIDWMKPYWLAAEINGNEVSIRKLTHITEINECYCDADAVLIDIPVGLPESAEEDCSRPDRWARSLLSGNRKSTIFPVPCRQAIGMETYEKASAENERVLGRKLTSQSYGFSKMIRQVDDFLDEIIRDFETLYRDNAELTSKLEAAEAEVSHLKAKSDEVEKSLELARYQCEEMKKNARLEAEAIIQKAKLSTQTVAADIESSKIRMKALCAEFLEKIDNI